MEPGGATTHKTYKIGQAAKLLDVKPFVLRFWEGEFREVLVPVRTPSGQRAYTEGNLDTVRRIKRLLYEEGLTIEGAKKRLQAGAADSGPAAQSGQAQADHAASARQAAQAQLPVAAAAPAQADPVQAAPIQAAGVAPIRDTALLREVEGELSALLKLLSRP